MKVVVGTVLMLVGLGAVACSDGGEAGGDSGGGGAGATRTIERESIPDSRFKPQQLEDIIDELVTEVQSSEVPDDLTIGVVLKELTNFWRPVAVGANRAIGELEVIGSVLGSTAEERTVPESVAEQKAFVEEQIESKVNGLAIAPHNEDLLDLMGTFSESGAPMVTIDSDLPDSERAIYIGTDSIQAGITGGETMVEFLDGTEGRVLILGNTDPSWAGGYDRTNSAATIIEDAGNEVEIINSVWVPDDEVEQIKAAIEDDSSGKPLVGMIGVFANAHALATAAVELELEEMPVIVAFDFEPDTLSYMEEGIISATHVQRQYYMGYMSVYLLFSINAIGLDKTKDILGDSLLHGFHLDTGLDVIRSNDLDEYNSFVDELGI